MQPSIMCRSILGPLVVLLVLGGYAPASEKEDVVAFLKKSVLGRKLEHHSTDKMANNTLETEFVRESVFANLQESAEGFTYDKLFVIRQTIWDLNVEQKRIGQGRQEDRQLTMRYEFKTRKSTGHLLGCSRVLTNSMADPTGVVNFARIELHDGRLIITESSVGYDDYFGRDGKFEPASSDSQTTMEIKNGKLYSSESVISFNVDPETLQRTSKRDAFNNVDTEIGVGK